MVSSTDLPTGRSFIVICLKTPWGLIMKRPLRGIPASSPSVRKDNTEAKTKKKSNYMMYNEKYKGKSKVMYVPSINTPYSVASFFVTSAMIGIFISPRPPLFLGVFVQAKWEYLESHEAAITCVLMASKSATLSLKAIISVGQTKVKSRG